MQVDVDFKVVQTKIAKDGMALSQNRPREEAFSARGVFSTLLRSSQRDRTGCDVLQVRRPWMKAESGV